MLSHLSIVLLHVTHIELLCFRCLVLPSVFVCVFFFHPKVFRHIVLHVPTHYTSTANRSAQRFVRFYVACECVPTFIIIVMIFFSSSCLLCAAYHQVLHMFLHRQNHHHVHRYNNWLWAKLQLVQIVSCRVMMMMMRSMYFYALNRYQYQTEQWTLR